LHADNITSATAPKRERQNESFASLVMVSLPADDLPIIAETPLLQD
jgi:hypothetical protein